MTERNKLHFSERLEGLFMKAKEASALHEKQNQNREISNSVSIPLEEQTQRTQLKDYDRFVEKTAGLFKFGCDYSVQDFIGVESESDLFYFASVDLGYVFDELAEGEGEGGGVWLSCVVAAVDDLKYSAEVMELESLDGVIKEFLKENLFGY
ncbi:hypothetical protein Acr_05g0004060 [Actinidia rufa]|uniref:Uncharacterized protein n=1 Tax=Actinidia rufa TaxID=165716 RepID=A0A7J0EMG2_9ERIC|nr:hypothetical protein Acr_05g0004060 [Actinidia rufa]